MVPRPLSVTARERSCFREPFRSTVRSSKNCNRPFGRLRTTSEGSRWGPRPLQAGAIVAQLLAGLVVEVIFFDVDGAAVPLGYVLEPPLPTEGGSALREDAK